MESSLPPQSVHDSGPIDSIVVHFLNVSIVQKMHRMPALLTPGTLVGHKMNCIRNG